jgi:hypothetical protein
MKSLLLAFAIALATASTSAADGNLVTNANFNSDVSSWMASNQFFFATWDSLDSAGLQTSGSARVTSQAVDAIPGGGLGQCVPLTPGSYEVTALYFIPSGQNRTAAPDIAIAWFVDSSCMTSSVDSHGSPQQSLIPQGASTTAAWLQLGDIVATPSDAMSRAIMSGRFILRPRKVEAGGSVDVLFDAVFVPEPEPAALGLATAAALALRRWVLS